MHGSRAPCYIRQVLLGLGPPYLAPPLGSRVRKDAAYDAVSRKDAADIASPISTTGGGRPSVATN